MSRNSIKVLPGALVCEESKLRGDVTIGAGTIVHPSAIIIAECGPIIIGENCLIEEQAKIIHRLPFDQQNKENTPVLIIGSYNVFEVDCTVEAPKIGNHNVFESKCFVGNKVTVSNGCTIGAGCKITDEQILKENLSIFGSSCQMRECLDKPVNIMYGLSGTVKGYVESDRVEYKNKENGLPACWWSPLIINILSDGAHRYKPQTLQMETLIKMLPNYHHVRKPNRKA